MKNFMDKYKSKILIVILIASLILNFYFYRHISEYEKQKELEFESNINNFYALLVNTYSYLNQFDFVDSDEIPSDVFIARLTVNLKNDLEDLSTLVYEILDYKKSHYDLKKLAQYLFSFYFYYQTSSIDDARFLSQNGEELEIINQIKNEFSIIIQHLPNSTEEYMKLSSEEELKLWLEIVNELSPSEELKQYKQFIQFDRIQNDL